MVNRNGIINTDANEYAYLICKLENIIDSLYNDSANDVVWDYLYSKRDYITPELSRKLMDWVNSIDGIVPNLYEIPQISKHLTAKDMNLIAHKIINNNGTYDCHTLVNIISANYPQYLNSLNYDELFALDLASLSNIKSYCNIFEWMEVSDSVGHKIVSAVAVCGLLARLADYLNDMPSLRCQYLLQYGSSCLQFLLRKSVITVITVEDIVEVYKIPDEAIIGVYI